NAKLSGGLGALGGGAGGAVIGGGLAGGKGALLGGLGGALLGGISGAAGGALGGMYQDSRDRKLDRYENPREGAASVSHNPAGVDKTASVMENLEKTAANFIGTVKGIAGKATDKTKKYVG